VLDANREIGVPGFHRTQDALCVVNNFLIPVGSPTKDFSSDTMLEE